MKLVSFKNLVLLVIVMLWGRVVHFGFRASCKNGLEMIMEVLDGTSI